MNNLSTTFKKLSPANKIKFVVRLPFLCLITVIDGAVDLLAIVYDWTRRFLYRRWKEVIVVTLAIVVIAIPITVAIHVDQTVHTFKGATKAQAEKYVYTNCHEMANNFIIAEDKNVRGYVRADERNIDRLISVISQYRFSDRDLLISWLVEFKNGDYSNAVDFHNYCWEELDGEIGYATALKKQYR